MKLRSTWKRALGLALTLAMLVSVLPVNALAAQGDVVDGNTRLQPNTFNPEDTINLPIEIYDYPADGMLFEYSSQPEASQPAANWWRSAFWGWGNNFARMENPGTSPW